MEAACTMGVVFSYIPFVAEWNAWSVCSKTLYAKRNNPLIISALQFKISSYSVFYNLRFVLSNICHISMNEFDFGYKTSVDRNKEANDYLCSQMRKCTRLQSFTFTIADLNFGLLLKSFLPFLQQLQTIKIKHVLPSCADVASFIQLPCLNYLSLDSQNFFAANLDLCCLKVNRLKLISGIVPGNFADSPLLPSSFPHLQHLTLHAADCKKYMRLLPLCPQLVTIKLVLYAFTNDFFTFFQCMLNSFSCLEKVIIEIKLRLEKEEVPQLLDLILQCKTLTSLEFLVFNYLACVPELVPMLEASSLETLICPTLHSNANTYFEAHPLCSTRFYSPRVTCYKRKHDRNVNQKRRKLQ